MCTVIVDLFLFVSDCMVLTYCVHSYTADYGQRAFVGKVNMDQKSPDFYREDTQQSLRDTRRYGQHLRYELFIP